MGLDLRQEVRHCAIDFDYTAKTYLKIEDQRRLIPLLRRPAQKVIRAAMLRSRVVKILKGRGFGASTEIAKEYFLEALFHKYTRVLVLAHSDKSAKKIFAIYKTFYNNLPDFLQLPLVGKMTRERIEFVNGSFIDVMTANSEAPRGTRYSHIHASEAAFWDKLGTSIAAIFNTAWEGAQVVVETTGNGVGSFADFWHDENGFEPVFLSWLDEETCRTSGPLPTDLREDELEYLTDHVLTPDQALWAINKKRQHCANDIAVFKQEYPATPDEAFRATGEPYFRGVETGLVHRNCIEDYGWRYGAPLSKNGVYVAGIDTASGSSNGDFSSMSVLEVPLTWKPGDQLHQVATFYAHEMPKAFARAMIKVCKEFNILTVIESNTYGLSIIEEFIEAQHLYLYRKVRVDQITNRLTEDIGYDTRPKSRQNMLGRLHDLLWNNKLTLFDNRVQFEMDHFAYNRRNKPEAMKGYHDDLIVATALACVGVDQLPQHIDDVRHERRPRTIEQRMAWEEKTNLDWATHGQPYFDEMEESEAKLAPLISKSVLFQQTYPQQS